VVVELFTSNVKEILYYAFFPETKGAKFDTFFFSCLLWISGRKKKQKNTEKNSRDV